MPLFTESCNLSLKMIHLKYHPYGHHYRNRFLDKLFCSVLNMREVLYSSFQKPFYPLDLSMIYRILKH